MKHIPKIINIVGLSENKGRCASSEKGKIPYIEQIGESNVRKVLKKSKENPNKAKVPLLESIMC